MGKHREAAFDVAKGAAIIAVILGHSGHLGVSEEIVDVCFTFHMPLFFVISGYFCNSETVVNREFFEKNIQGLLLPYVVTCLLVMITSFFVIAGVAHSWAAGWERFLEYAFASIWGAGGSSLMPDGGLAIGALWYLLALFWGKLFLALCNCGKAPLVTVAGLFAIGYLTTPYFWLPLSLQAGLCATLFLYVGQAARKGQIFTAGRLPGWCWLVMAIAWLVYIQYGGRLYMVSNSYGTGLLDVPGTLCGGFVIIKACSWLSVHATAAIAPLEYLGRITLPVFCMHVVEMDSMPWVNLEPIFSTLPGASWFWGVGMRILVVMFLTSLLYVAPRFLSGVFFPSRRPHGSEERGRAGVETAVDVLPATGFPFCLEATRSLPCGNARHGISGQICKRDSTE